MASCSFAVLLAVSGLVFWLKGQAANSNWKLVAVASAAMMALMAYHYVELDWYSVVLPFVALVLPLAYPKPAKWWLALIALIGVSSLLISAGLYLNWPEASLY